MAQANDLALRGWGRAYPNPLVGAVVVREGVVVGEGYHAEFGAPHAEAMALAAAGERARGATLYVTLEPCTHFGKQPPCVEAILASEVAHVVVAVADPNPAAAGGAAKLRKSGVVVEMGVLGQQVARRNFRFLRQFTAPVRPFVAIKLAVSLDGMIADAAGHSRWVSSDGARDWAHWLRAGFGAIAIGARSAIADGARLTVRGPLQPRLVPARVVFDRSGKLTPTHPMLADVPTAPVIVVVGTAVAEASRAALRNTGVEIVVADVLPDALGALAAWGVDSMLVEGGGRLAGALLRAGVVDRVYQVQCPLWLGDGIPAWAGLGTPAIESVARWHVTEQQTLGDPGDVMIELEP